MEACGIAEGMMRIVLHAPEIAGAALPGQFVMVESGARDSLLRRPFGVSGTNVSEGSITLRFAVVGKGTAWLAGRQAGDSVSLSGPYGSRFEIRGASCILIGGGTGVAPLLFLKDEIEKGGGKAVLVAGARNKLCLMESDMLAASCVIATEDGSLGDAGFVTAPLGKLLDESRFDCAYACGPMPMLKAVKPLLAMHNIPLQVSLETIMGCGVGACNGCTCDEARKGAGWLKVCTDGPVFDAKEVLI
jgi:dihydroorotate dehydrogenase electron transfer subunit